MSENYYHPEASYLFTKTFLVSVTNFSNISTFWRISRRGLVGFSSKLFEENLGFSRDFFGTPEYEKIFISSSARNEVLEMVGGVMGMAGQITRLTKDKCFALVDSASIVFSHSILDAAALDYCQVTSLIDPNSWSQYVSKKKIELGYLSQKSYDQILKEEIQQHLKNLDRESLIFKVQRLFSICKPDANFDPIRGYKFDLERLEKIDRLRHQIVHGLGPTPQLENANLEIDFMLNTSNFLMSLLNMRYSLKVWPEFIPEILAPSHAK